jgi:flagellar basal body-associated protein FliL
MKKKWVWIIVVVVVLIGGALAYQKYHGVAYYAQGGKRCEPANG